ncbi:MAG: BCCT family transporter [Pseudomonadota bacterium]
MGENLDEKQIAEIEEIYETDFEIGQDNVNMFGLDLHNPVFFFSSLLMIVFVVGTLIFPTEANEALGGAKQFVIDYFDWLLMISANVFVLFCLTLIFLPVGKIRLGGQDANPEFSRPSWFAMLFAAGMGIGLMFWSVAEPMAYFHGAWYGAPLGGPTGSSEAATNAMGATMFHWGLHPWAIYAVVALSLAFFAYNKGLPLTIRSAFYPVMGDRIWGWPGHIIDTVAVVATIFGLATSLGFGAQQAASGLDFLFETGSGINVQIAVIVGVTAVALFSVIRGLDGGVKLLSNINMTIAIALVLFIFFAGSTLELVGWMGKATWAYARDIIPLSNWIGRDDSSWFHGWTVFYWAWWISWSPFVGMFIARVSYGRTVREFLTAVLVIPTIITIGWMGIFGGSGLDQALNNVGQFATELGDHKMALFEMFKQLPFTEIIAFIAIVLVLIFFVTSSDSGSLVIDSITAGGKLDAPVSQRIFWAVMEGLIAGALLFGGGDDALKALQSGSVATGLPFAVVLLVMCFSLYKGLHHERLLIDAGK